MAVLFAAPCLAVTLNQCYFDTVLLETTRGGGFVVSLQKCEADDEDEGNCDPYDVMRYVKLPALESVQDRGGADRDTSEQCGDKVDRQAGYIAYGGGDQEDRAGDHDRGGERFSFAFRLCARGCEREQGVNCCDDAQCDLHFFLRGWSGLLGVICLVGKENQVCDQAGEVGQRGKQPRSACEDDIKQHYCFCQQECCRHEPQYFSPRCIISAIPHDDSQHCAYQCGRDAVQQPSGETVYCQLGQ